MDIAKLIATLGLDNTEYLETLDESVSEGKSVRDRQIGRASCRERV